MIALAHSALPVFLAIVPSPRVTPTVPVTQPVWISRRIPDPSRVHDQCAKRVPRGTPIIEAELLRSGTVGDVRITRSTGCAPADKLLRDAVKTWKFKPATQEGKPIDTWLTMTISDFLW